MPSSPVVLRPGWLAQCLFGSKREKGCPGSAPSCGLPHTDPECLVEPAPAQVLWDHFHLKERTEGLRGSQSQVRVLRALWASPSLGTLGAWAGGLSQTQA